MRQVSLYGIPVNQSFKFEYYNLTGDDTPQG
jgi:hypothetical protein